MFPTAVEEKRVIIPPGVGGGGFTLYLKRLELIGFKSFADKTELEFGPGITAVVGPNGSGKSNVSDAIRWVLGEMSARDLRGTRMEDVIFGGSSSRKPMNYAQVSITFDNADGVLKLPYREVEVTRRVDRAGDSEYLINQNQVRLRDILELFLDTGIGKENYSVIGQGRIDEILSAKPEDRRAIFEEAAGIAKYKQRKKEATRKLAETEQNLMRVYDLITELESQLSVLAEQAETARRFQQLNGELTDLEVGLLARHLQQAGAELAQWQQKLAELKGRLEETDLALADQEQALDTARNLTAALDQEVNALQAELVETAARLERAEGHQNLLRQESEQARREEERLAAESASLTERQAAQAKELAELDQRLREVAGALAAARAELAAREQEQAAAQGEAGAVSQELEQKRARAFELARQVSERRSLAASEERARERALERLARLELEHAQAMSARLNAQADHDQREQQLTELAERQAEVNEHLVAAAAQEQQATAAANAAAERISRLRERIEALSSRLGLLEELKASFEGFHKGSRTVLQARDQKRPWARGVIGAVAELVQCDPQHEKAIEVALGAAVQNIVTQSEDDAKACIAELKRISGGRATFLPLSIVRPSAFREDELRDLAAEPGFMGVALELCRFEGRLRPVMANLLGRVAVARDLDAAVAIGRRTGFRHRIVTLDGELLHPGGAMTGGSQEGRSSGLLARERELQELQAEMAARKEELAAARQDLHDARDEKEQVTRHRLDLEQELKRLEVAAAAARAERERHAAECARLQQTMTGMDAELAQVRSEVENGGAAVERLVQEAEYLAAEQAAMEREFATLGDAARQLLAKAQAAGEAVTAVRVQIAGLEQEERSLREQEGRLRAELDELTREAARRETALTELAQRRARLAVELEQAAAELARAGEARGALVARQESLQTRRQQAQADVNERERELRSLRRRQSDLTNRISEAAAQEARFQAEVESAVQRLAEQFELTPEQVQGRELAEESLPFARQRAQALREEIRALGPVNLAAIGEHARALERHEFLLQQRADLDEAKAALFRAIEELDRRIISQFDESFQTIRREFQKVYAELFEGGKADLVLVDETDLLETGIEIMVQPPGKKPIPLSLLSGGERAMTAIALLFALLRYRPSPFVVLDEVEAALDEANVERVGRYLKQLCESTQFICITHQRGTMEAANALYGVTMEGTGVSRVVSVRFSDVQPARAG